MFKLMSIESVLPFNYLILCCSLLLPPSVFPSIRVFANESTLHISSLKYWNLSFSISPSSEYSGLISFRIDWFDLLAVQGSLKSLLQYHSSKASILRCSVFLYGPTLTSMNYSLHGFSVLGILQARMLEWVAVSFSRGYSQSRDRTQVFCIAGKLFII